MASKFRRENGMWVIKFKIHSRYKKLRLKTEDATTAQSVKEMIERIVGFLEEDIPLDVATTRWIYNQKGDLKEQLARYGLSPATEQITSLFDLVEFYLDHHAGKKEVSRENCRRAFDRLKKQFGDVHINSITEGDAKQYYQWLQQHGNSVTNGPLAEGSYSREIKRVKTLFRRAVEKRWITHNPFESLRGGSQSNPEGFFDVVPEIANLVLDKLKSIEFQIVFALGRWGGLRLPSEAIALEWSWINWEKNRFKVWSQKLDDSVMYRTREVPIFPELRPYLEKARDSTNRHKTHVCKYLQSNNLSSLKKRVVTVLKTIHVDPWPNFWKNLRATRANEVERLFGSYCESAWIGHNEHTSRRHYMHATESDYSKAISPQVSNLGEIIQSGDLDQQLQRLSDEDFDALVTAIKQFDQVTS